jgi:hypothetical protein
MSVWIPVEPLMEPINDETPAAILTDLAYSLNIYGDGDGTVKIFGWVPNALRQIADRIDAGIEKRKAEDREKSE